MQTKLSECTFHKQRLLELSLVRFLIYCSFHNGHADEFLHFCIQHGQIIVMIFLDEVMILFSIRN